MPRFNSKQQNIAHSKLIQHSIKINYVQLTPLIALRSLLLKKYEDAIWLFNYKLLQNFESSLYAGLMLALLGDFKRLHVFSPLFYFEELIKFAITSF